MRTFRIAVVLFFAINLCHAQGSRFLNGKITPLEGEVISVEINYGNWIVTPDEIEYRINSSSDLIKVTPKQIKGFEIDNLGSYVSHNVRIDVSSDNLSQLSSSSEPDWQVRDLFLQEVLISETSLLSYESERVKRFFYQVGKLNQPVQLVYKKFKPSNALVASNNAYKKQLWDNFQCGGITQEELKKLDYYKRDLVKFFTKYNECQGFNISKAVKKDAKGKLQFGIRAGLSLVSGSFEKFNSLSDNNGISDFSTTGLRLDGEIEYLTPLNNRRVSVFMNFGFEQFSTNGTWGQELLFNENRTATRNMDVDWTADYSNLAIGVGIRKYVFLSNNLELLIDYMILPNIDLSTNYEYDVAEIDGFIIPAVALDTNSKLYHGLGLGLKSNSYTFGLRYFLDRTFLKNPDELGSNDNIKFTSLTLQFGVVL